MARVRCIMMQRDEGQLLDAWLKYYGYLFGFENLEVLDNGSRDPLTVFILEQFEAVGVLVYRQHTGIEAFERKGSIIHGIINGWDLDHQYDFALPCDCDEFLALFTRAGLSCARSAIHAGLDRLTDSGQALGIRTSLFNVPLQTDWFHPDVFPKGFLPSHSILELDSGYHEPKSRLQVGMRDTDFTYLHFHNKPYETVQAHTRRKMYRRVDIEDRDAMQRYRGAGEHMIKDLLMSREEYVHQFDHRITVCFEQFTDQMRALGARESLLTGDATLLRRHQRTPEGKTTIRLPAGETKPSHMIAFDSAAYLSNNPDVHIATGCGLPHYLYYGFREGREAVPAGAAK